MGWSILKRTVDHSVRYADLNSHLDAVYKFIGEHKRDYDFAKYWKRKPPERMMNSYMKSNRGLDPAIVKL